MDLYLMRHADYLPKDKDPEEGLTSRGEGVAKSMGQILRNKGLAMDTVLTSPKKRARQTAALVAGKIDFAEDSIVVSDLIKPSAPPEQTLGLLAEQRNAERVLVVGHLPLLNLVGSLLVQGKIGLEFDFQPGALVHIQVKKCEPGGGGLGWHLAPRYFKNA